MRHDKTMTDQKNTPQNPSQNIPEGTANTASDAPIDEPRWQLIETAAQLEAILPQLTNAPYLAVDTEFYRRVTYWAQLCLIQIATPDAVFLIDPQGGKDARKNPDIAETLDLTPLWSVLVKASIPKIFHAPKEDLSILVHHMHGHAPTPLFDTQLAAMYCGFRDQISYGDLVHDLCGVSLDKSSQVMDWRKRPLTTKQQKYAADDVIYLREVFGPLMSRIETLERTEMVRLAMEELGNPQAYIPNPMTAWQTVKGKMPSNPAGRHAVQLVAAWRETEAINANRPRSHIMDDKTITELSKRLPKDIKSLPKLPKIKEKYTKGKVAEHLLDLVEQAKNLPPEDAPLQTKTVRLSTRQQERYTLLQMAMNILSQEAQIIPYLVLSRDELSQIAKDGAIPDTSPLADKSLADKSSAKDDAQNWRYNMFGEKLQCLLNGKKGIALSDKGHLTFCEIN